jgi:hypothetical protein
MQTLPGGHVGKSIAGVPEDPGIRD